MLAAVTDPMPFPHAAKLVRALEAAAQFSRFCGGRVDVAIVHFVDMGMLSA